MTKLRADKLFKTYGRRPVVRGVSLEVSAGEIVALLGRNGAGKTTTFRMMAGLLKPDGGRLLLDGDDISGLGPAARARRGITYLPQESSAFLKTSVQGNVLMVLELRGAERAGRRERCRAILADLGLLELAGRPAHSLSGGERRRLEVGRALVLDPRFLLLDEPFTGIDPLTIRDLQRIFLRLRDRGIGLVLSDHNVRDAFAVSSRAVVVDAGEVLAEGPPPALAADERVRERFLGQGFRMGEEVQE